MRKSITGPAALLAAAALLASTGPSWADNQMGYRMLSQQQAASMPRHGGSLGMDVGPGPRITESGLDFELLQVKAVRRGSPAANSGLKSGDQIIAADGNVFPSVAAFAAFVGSTTPGERMTLDVIPAGGGPAQAERAAVTVGSTSGAVAPHPEAQASSGMSTGTKLAIGAGAVALFGCYKYGCFGHPGRSTQPSPR